MIWTKPQAFLLLLLITKFQTVKLQADDRCSGATAERLLARVLKGHVISSAQTNSFEGCVDRCFRNSKCYSINYYNRKERCELNDKTTFMNPEDLVRELDGTYLDILRPYSDCSDLFCDRDQICKMERADRSRCKGWRCHSVYFLILCIQHFLYSDWLRAYQFIMSNMWNWRVQNLKLQILEDYMSGFSFSAKEVIVTKQVKCQEKTQRGVNYCMPIINK